MGCVLEIDYGVFFGGFVGGVVDQVVVFVVFEVIEVYDDWFGCECGSNVCYVFGQFFMEKVVW